jgi:hypothetical protein
MRRLLAAAVVLAMATPAGATEWIACSGDSDAVQANILVSMMDVLSISSANVEAGGKKWAVGAEGDAAIRIGQAFEDSDTIHVDFTDEQVSTVIAQLRLFKATEGDLDATGGILRVPGVGAWAVSCSGP